MIPNFAILVPCYNEAETIAQVGSELRKTIHSFLIVNDGSTDHTEHLLQINSLNHLSYLGNKGKGYAIKYGAECIIHNGFDYILIMDADGQNIINDIEPFIDCVNDNPDVKIVIGNRLDNKKNMPFIRYWTNKIMSYIVSKLAGVKIIDTQCGMRMVHKDVFKLETESENFEYESEQLIKAGRKGYKILSVPIHCIYKKGRESKMNPLRDTIRFIKMIKKFK